MIFGRSAMLKVTRWALKVARELELVLERLKSP
jgi:hypothetical protein